MKLRRYMTIKDFFESPFLLAIHCDTEEKAKMLLENFDRSSYKWKTGHSYLKYNCWDMYTEDTCYTNYCTYADVEWCIDNNVIILDVDDMRLFTHNNIERRKKYENQC